MRSVCDQSLDLLSYATIALVSYPSCSIRNLLKTFNSSTRYETKAWDKLSASAIDRNDLIIALLHKWKDVLLVFLLLASLSDTLAGNSRLKSSSNVGCQFHFRTVPVSKRQTAWWWERIDKKNPTKNTKLTKYLFSSWMTGNPVMLFAQYEQYTLFLPRGRWGWYHCHVCLFHVSHLAY